jgi:hypothetical protein
LIDLSAWSALARAAFVCRYCKNNAPSGVVKFVTLDFDPSVPLSQQRDEMSDSWTPDHFLWYVKE